VGCLLLLGFTKNGVKREKHRVCGRSVGENALLKIPSRRPHRVPLISTTNRKNTLQFTRAHQNQTVEDWKNVAWSDESRFLLRISDQNFS